jgi:hypothetical protein
LVLNDKKYRLDDLSFFAKFFKKEVNNFKKILEFIDKDKRKEDS